MHPLSLNSRALVSLLMASGMFVLALSGFVLFASPSGKLAHDLGWTFLGMDKGIWRNMHIAFGFFILPVALFHIAFNWQSLTSYLGRKGAFSAMFARKQKFRAEPIIALALFALIVLASIFNYPPVSYLRDAQDSLRAHWQSMETNN